MNQNRKSELAYLVRTNCAVCVVPSRKKFDELSHQEDRYTVRELINENYFEYLELISTNTILVKANMDITISAATTEGVHIKQLSEGESFEIKLDDSARNDFFDATDDDIPEFLCKAVFQDIANLNEVELQQLLDTLREDLAGSHPFSDNSQPGTFGYNYNLRKE